jgi:hypothetical protein
VSSDRSQPKYNQYLLSKPGALKYNPPPEGKKGIEAVLVARAGVRKGREKREWDNGGWC